MVSKRINNIEGSKTTEVAGIAYDMVRQGKDVISLTIGESDFKTPKYIVEALSEAVSENKGQNYTANEGLLELRQAIVDFHQEKDAMNYETSEVFVSNGAKSIIYALLQVLVEAGDEVIIQAPYWVSYVEQVKLAEGQPVIVETRAREGFKLKVSDLDAVYTKKTKVLILNYPNNPSGAVLNQEELRLIGEWAVARDVLIISDEIYNQLIYEQSYIPSLAAISPEIKAQSIIVNGVSKAYAMTGFRIGYALAEEYIIKGLKKFISHAAGNPAGLSQYAAIEAYSGPQEEVEVMRQAFEERCHNAFKQIQEVPGLKMYEKPAGAFYLFPHAQVAAEMCGYHDVDEWVKALLTEAGVAIVSGSAFGMPEHVRLSYATNKETFNEACERIKNFIKTKMKST